jgi:iron complex outermembrane receptor protein
MSCFSYSKYHQSEKRTSGTFQRLLLSALLVPSTAAATGASAQSRQESGPTASRTETLALPEILVEGDRTATGTRTIGAPPPAFSGGQVARGARTGALGNLDYMNSPFSSQSFTKEFMENFQLRSAGDVLLKDPSVSAWLTANPIYDHSVKIRGFPHFAADAPTSFNGLAGIDFYEAPIQILERVELLKGPGAFLNGGLGAVGGAVNYVTKRATDDPITTITGSFMSRNVLGGHVDFGRRFGENKEFGIRINAFGNGGDLALKDARRSDKGVAIGLDYRGERLRVDADLYAGERELNGWNWDVTLAPGLSLPKAPRPSTLFQPPWTPYPRRAQAGMVRVEYDLAPNWSVGIYGGASHTDEHFTFCTPSILNYAGDAFCSGGWTTNYNKYRKAATGFLRGEFDTGPIRHRVYFGANYSDDELRSQPGIPYGPAYSFNIYNPIFPAETPIALGATRKSTLSHMRSVYLADTLSVLDDRIRFTAGVRRTNIERGTFNINNGLRTAQYDTWATTPAFGLLVKLTPQLSLYGNVIEALERGGTAPQTARNAGQVFPALVSKQEEIGLKGDFGRIGGSLALYRINRANQYLDASTNTYTQDGRQTNKGIELNIYGEPIEGLRLIAGAAAIDARLKQTSGGLYNGRRAPAVPLHELRLTGEWDIPWVKGLTLTGGLIHSGPAPYDNANTFKIPAWTRIDLGARYVWSVAGTKMTARLAVENVGNSAYWVAGYGSAGLQLSPPRTVMFSLTADLTPSPR